jgi:hypothetical protein
MSAGIRIQCKLSHTGEAGESLLQVVVEFESALSGSGILEGMQAGKCRHSSDLLIDLRVILHGAAAQRIESGVDAEVLVREQSIVSHHVEFANLGEVGRLFAEQVGRDSCQSVSLVMVCGELIALTSGT